MTPLVAGRNVVLAGMMGSGKSTVGGLAAERLGRPFVDTDVLVEQNAGATIATVFEEQGEPAFREMEAAVIRGVSAVRGQVIAVGGGALLRAGNVTALQGTGDIVVLDATPEALAVRVRSEAGGRPLLAGQEDLVARLDALRATRWEAYVRAAAKVIDTTGLGPLEVVAAVLAWARLHPGVLAAEEREALV